MAFELKGTVIHIGPTNQVTEKLRKREIVVQDNTNEKFPQEIKFEAVNDKCTSLDELRTGDEVNIHFNINGRPFEKNGNKQWFNSLGIWKFDVLKKAQQSASSGMGANTNFDQDPF